MVRKRTDILSKRHLHAYFDQCSRLYAYSKLEPDDQSKYKFKRFADSMRQLPVVRKRTGLLSIRNLHAYFYQCSRLYAYSYLEPGDQSKYKFKRFADGL